MILHSLIVFFFGSCLSLENGLARVPPKGWLSWQYNRCDTNCTDNPDGCLNDIFVMKTADYLVSSGLKDAGYEYIIIDDCWMEKKRDSDGKLVADKKRFPNGIKALTDYLHKKGLKFGIYADMGLYTCQGYPGSLLYLNIDAKTFAEWGVDYLKMDGCYGSTDLYDTGYPLMSHFLNKTGRPVLFSCSWPDYESNPNYENVAKYCNIWRNSGDIEDSWNSITAIIDVYGQDKGGFLEISAPGQFNDPDMLLFGSYGLSHNAQRTQLIMWSMLAAPLMLSTNLTRLDDDLLQLLKNKHILELNNDILGKSATQHERKGDTRVWVKQLSRNRIAFAFVSFATGGNEYHYTTKLTGNKSTSYKVVELTTNRFLGFVNGGDYFTATLAPYSTFAIVLQPRLMSDSIHLSISITD